MKKLLFILSLISLDIRAELIQKNDRDLYDLMWLPPSKTFFGSTQITFNDSKFRPLINDREIGDYKISTQNVTQTLGYSFNQRWALLLQGEYLIGRKVTFEPLAGEKEVTQEAGMGDPRLISRVRVLDQSKNLLTMDLIPSILLGMGESQEASAQKDGNNHQGGNAASLRMELGKKYTAFQWMGFAFVEQNAKAEGKSLVNGHKTEQNSYLSYGGGLRVQGGIDESFLLVGALEYQWDQGFRVRDKISGTWIETSELDSLTFSGGLTWLADSRLNLTVLFNIGTTGSFSQEEDTGTKVDYQNGTLTGFELLARYLF